MKNSKRNVVNLLFSSFLVIGFIVCTYFFSNLAKQVKGLGGSLIHVAILLIFGLLLFYATRVGEGKQVKRFSLPVLLLLDIPCIYIIAAALIKPLPLHEQLAPVDGVFPIILILATIALGYGIPYTFLSGYELNTDDEEEEEQTEEAAEEKDEKEDRDENKAPVSEAEKETVDEESAEAEEAEEADEEKE